MVGGNALGDNSQKNDTAEGDKKREESFHEKYRRELKKDFDDLVNEDDDEEEEPAEGTEAETGDEAEPEAPKLNLDDLMNDDEAEEAGEAA